MSPVLRRSLGLQRRHDRPVVRRLRAGLAIMVFALGTAVSAQPSGRDAAFIISADGQEVLDTQTRLVWRRCLEGQQLRAGRCEGEPMMLDWSVARARLANQPVMPGGGPWRLPGMQELTTTVDMTQPGSPVDARLFPDTPRVYVWSADVNERMPTQAWAMFYANGYLMSAWQSLQYPVRAVRNAGP